MCCCPLPWGGVGGVVVAKGVGGFGASGSLCAEQFLALWPHFLPPEVHSG